MRLTLSARNGCRWFTRSKCFFHTRLTFVILSKFNQSICKSESASNITPVQVPGCLMSLFLVSGHCSFFVGRVFPESQPLQSIIAAWRLAPWNECAGACSFWSEGNFNRLSGGRRAGFAMDFQACTSMRLTLSDRNGRRWFTRLNFLFSHSFNCCDTFEIQSIYIQIISNIEYNTGTSTRLLNESVFSE